VIKPRALAADADLSIVRVSETVRIGDRERPIRFPDDFDFLEREVVAHHIGLLVVDPLLGFLSQSVDSNKDQSVRDVLHHLKLLAERTGAAVVGLRHFSKAGSGNALYRGLGSIAITAAARSALAVDEHPTEKGVHVLATAKCNLVRLPRSVTYRITELAGQPVVTWGEETDISAADLGVRHVGRPDHARDDAVEFLRGILASGPVTAAEAKSKAAKAGISDRTLDRAKRLLGVRTHKKGFESSAWVWELPTPDADGPTVISFEGRQQ
jgi:hypothetical protein